MKRVLKWALVVVAIAVLVLVCSAVLEHGWRAEARRPGSATK